MLIDYEKNKDNFLGWFIIAAITEITSSGRNFNYKNMVDLSMSVNGEEFDCTKIIERIEEDRKRACEEARKKGMKQAKDEFLSELEKLFNKEDD